MGVTMININDLSKVYKTYHNEVTALENINITIREGDFLAVVGKSGCGKTTLLNILAGLLQATSGSFDYKGISVVDMNKRSLDQYRREHVGIILQNFSLLNDRNVYENIELPLKIRQYEKRKRNDLVWEYLEKMDMLDKINAYPRQLSGGQKQRIAIARALASAPDIILADEPTGSLDESNAGQIIDILGEIANNGKIVIMITHNMDLVSKCNRIVKLVDGKLAERS